VDQRPVSFISYNRKTAILHGQIWPTHKSDVVGLTAQELVPQKDGETLQPEHSVVIGMKNLVGQQGTNYHYFLDVAQVTGEDEVTLFKHVGSRDYPIVYKGEEINSADIRTRWSSTGRRTELRWKRTPDKRSTPSTGAKSLG
jgi:hypothetical protein